jgi:simple sugar transport system permease protein
MVEVAAVQGAASADLATGVGYTGILAAFLARMNPLALIPVCVMLGGLDAAGGLLQQRLGVPDATMLVLRGVLFVMLLSAESLQGRLTGWLPWRRARVPEAVAG